MDGKSAATIIASMRDSLQQNPSQFHLQITVAGQQITAYGGKGLEITATGGGPKSTTIGQIVSLEGSQVAIAQGRATEAMRQQMAALVATLDGIVTELQKARPDKTILQRFFEALKDTWVPGVITSVVANVLSQFLR